MDNQKREYWIKRITEELNSNGEPIWYDRDLVKQLDHFKIIETDLNDMSLITFRGERKKKNYYVTDEEDQKIRELIEQLRKPRE